MGAYGISLFVGREEAFLMRISMIPFGLLSGFMDSKEIRITELGEDGFRFRLAEECPEPEQFLICFYDMKKAGYRRVHFDKADVAPKKTLKEFRLDSIDGIEVGNILKADTFEVGEVVDVKGTSKGHGTAGAIKRWNFSRLRMTHGTGPNHRHAGSLGACSSPSRVFKGKKMAGHYGHETVTVQNLKIAKVDAERAELL